MLLSAWNCFAPEGLDFVWPFLLKYPRDKTAVIDEVAPLAVLLLGGSWQLAPLSAAAHIVLTSGASSTPFLTFYPAAPPPPRQVCIFHPPSNPQKGNSVYAAEAPFNQKEEVRCLCLPGAPGRSLCLQLP